jgi:hypothetical protein
MTKPRDILQIVLEYKGLFLQANNEVRDLNDKLVGTYANDATYVGETLSYTIWPVFKKASSTSSEHPVKLSY